MDLWILMYLTVSATTGYVPTNVGGVSVSVHNSQEVCESKLSILKTKTRTNNAEWDGNVFQVVGKDFAMLKCIKATQ